MPALFQVYSVMAMIFYGIIFGFVFETQNIFRFLTNKSKILRFVFDFVYALIGGTVFYYAIFVANFGIFRLFLLLMYVLGFLLEHKSVGFFVAKIFEMMYNKNKFISKEEKG